jgi:branched-chain amino acid transport system permease protein
MNTLAMLRVKTMTQNNAGARRSGKNVPAWRLPIIVLILGLALCFAVPDQYGLLTRIFILAIAVLSLDLVVGYAGLATLGHAAMFGVGAYATGIFALKAIGDPIIGLVVGAFAGGALAFLSGSFLLRYSGFTFLMLTVAVSQMVLSLAQKARNWTGGDDGLSGYSIAPIFGMLQFDLEGKLAAYYTLAVLVVTLYIAKRICSSPFGLSVRGIHENPARMSALGTPVYLRLLAMYTLGGAIAGIAGALSAQTTGVVGLDSLSFALSAELLVMLVLGGTGNLIGAVVGAAVFTALHHTASSINPYHWLFVVGGLLMLVVLVKPKKAWAWMRRHVGAKA